MWLMVRRLFSLEISQLIKHVADIKNALGRHYKSTAFSEFISNERIARYFRDWNPQASIITLENAGDEHRKRVFIADGFSIERLKLVIESKTAGADTVKDIVGDGFLKSKTGKRAAWHSTATGVKTITTTGMDYMDKNGNVQALTNPLVKFVL